MKPELVSTIIKISYNSIILQARTRSRVRIQQAKDSQTAGGARRGSLPGRRRKPSSPLRTDNNVIQSGPEAVQSDGSKKVCYLFSIGRL